MSQPSEKVSSNKDVQALVRLAREQGWTVASTGSGHLRWDPPDAGETYHSSSTPSSPRTAVNVRKDLEKMGLLSKEEWRRKKRSERKLNSLKDLTPDLLDPPAPEPDNLEKPMERELWPPPEDQRINCPDCTSFFWNTDHDGLIRHLQSDHGKAPCPDCYKVMLVTSLPAHGRTCRRRVTNNPLSRQLAEGVPHLEADPHGWKVKQADGQYHCPLCEYRSDAEKSVRGHMVGKHSRKEGTCEKCGKTMNLGQLAQHRKGGCVPKSQRREHCPKCGKVMLVVSIQKHIETACPGFADAQSHPAEPVAQKPVPPPSRPSTPPAHAQRATVDDDDLFAALEIIIGDTIPMRAIPAAMRWVEQTKELIALVDGN